jgi:hypothetical protein
MYVHQKIYAAMLMATLFKNILKLKTIQMFISSIINYNMIIEYYITMKNTDEQIQLPCSNMDTCVTHIHKISHTQYSMKEVRHDAYNTVSFQLFINNQV